MRLYKDKLGTYYADYYVKGKRFRKSLETKQKSVALLKLHKLGDPKKDLFYDCNFSDLVSKYKHQILSTRRHSTSSRFQSALNSFIDFGAPEKAIDVTPALLQNFQIWLSKKNLKPTSVNRTVRAIKVLLRQAEAWDIMPAQKWNNVKKLREPKGRIEFHTQEELNILLKSFNINWQVVIMLGARAGLRRGEMAVLKWQDIDLKNEQIYVAPNKTDTYRYVPICEDLLVILKDYKKLAKDSYVVHVGLDEKRTSDYYITAAYAKNCKDKKIPFKCFIHKLRHTFASHLVQAGVDLYTVSKLLGHSTIKMTEIYAHLAPETLKYAVKQFEKLDLKK